MIKRKDMLKSPIRLIRNEEGFVMGTSIMVSAVLILAGVFAIWMANTEMLLVRNESELVREFYNAEGGLLDAVENFRDPESGNLGDSWIAQGSLLEGGNASFSQSYTNGSGDVVAIVEARCILDEVLETPPALSDAANNLPTMPHVGPPPPGSGYSLKYFVVRRYGVTATSATGNTKVQAGVWTVFNKF
jgi:hypothetical protein